MKTEFNLQLFGGVYPVHNNVFKIGTKGRASVAGDMVMPKDLETFSPSIDGNTEEWTPMDTAGWIRRAVTGKGFTIGFSGKRNYGDPGNDYVSQLILAIGSSCESILEWTMPDSSVLTMNCIINLTTPGGGDSTNIDNLEFEVLSDGLPAFTPAAAKLTFVTVDGATAGKTKVATVAPALGGGNSYKYALNASIPQIGSILGVAFTAYTLNTDVTAVENDNFVLVEVVTATNVVVKVGFSHANVQ